ncbi:DUF1909-domain-containing protein [Calocera viscosa TUFC12733]|uniref:DUF1909-domain-containing protein n=1 Tax=Calocera viscosa (strain TUFC12733) TaxID=1330018 RepID=A0A167KTJ2_CALVF|nr:DUF1909-domain-containing protein [Calocera viscosa TUFC12733]
MGNGAKAQQKRERAAKDAKSSKSSQLKTNTAALTIVCTVCRATFLQTTRAPALEEHAQNKHSKALAECFPTFGK